MSDAAADFTDADVIAFFDAMEAGDLDGVRRSLEKTAHPDCELDAAGSAMEGTYRGREEMLRFFSELLDGFEPRYENRRLEWHGSSLIAHYQQRMRSRGTGLELSFPACAIFEVRDGLIARGKTVRGQADVDAAVAAAQVAS